MMSLSETVRNSMIEFRKKRNLRQKGFAETLGWGLHVIADLETGKTSWSLDKIEAVCQRFQVMPDYFLVHEPGFEGQTGYHRMMLDMEPECRMALRQLIKSWRITDIELIRALIDATQRLLYATRKKAIAEAQQEKEMPAFHSLPQPGE